MIIYIHKQGDPIKEATAPASTGPPWMMNEYEMMGEDEGVSRSGMRWDGTGSGGGV